MEMDLDVESAEVENSVVVTTQTTETKVTVSQVATVVTVGNDTEGRAEVEGTSSTVLQDISKIEVNSEAHGNGQLVIEQHIEEAFQQQRSPSEDGETLAFPPSDAGEEKPSTDTNGEVEPPPAETAMKTEAEAEASTSTDEPGSNGAAQPQFSSKPLPNGWPQTREEVKALFEKYDKNGNGYISVSERESMMLEESCFARYVEMPKKIRTRAFTLADRTGKADGRLSFSEFVTYLEFIPKCAELWEFFDFMDDNDDKKITFEEFSMGLDILDCHSEASPRLDFDAIDTNKSGKIDFDEFFEYFKGKSFEKENHGSAPKKSEDSDLNDRLEKKDSVRVDVSQSAGQQGDGVVLPELKTADLAEGESNDFVTPTAAAASKKIKFRTELPVEFKKFDTTGGDVRKDELDEIRHMKRNTEASDAVQLEDAEITPDRRPEEHIGGSSERRKLRDNLPVHFKKFEGNGGTVRKDELEELRQMKRAQDNPDMIKQIEEGTLGASTTPQNKPEAQGSDSTERRKLRTGLPVQFKKFEETGGTVRKNELEELRQMRRAQNMKKELGTGENAALPFLEQAGSTDEKDKEGRKDTPKEKKKPWSPRWKSGGGGYLALSDVESFYMAQRNRNKEMRQKEKDARELLQSYREKDVPERPVGRVAQERNKLQKFGVHQYNPIEGGYVGFWDPKAMVKKMKRTNRASIARARKASTDDMSVDTDDVSSLISEDDFSISSWDALAFDFSSPPTSDEVFGFTAASAAARANYDDDMHNYLDRYDFSIMRDNCFRSAVEAAAIPLPDSPTPSEIDSFDGTTSDLAPVPELGQNEEAEPGDVEDEEDPPQQEVGESTEEAEESRDLPNDELPSDKAKDGTEGENTDSDAERRAKLRRVMEERAKKLALVEEVRQVVGEWSDAVDEEAALRAELEEAKRRVKEETERLAARGEEDETEGPDMSEKEKDEGKKSTASRKPKPSVNRPISPTNGATPRVRTMLRAAKSTTAKNAVPVKRPLSRPVTRTPRPVGASPKPTSTKPAVGASPKTTSTKPAATSKSVSSSSKPSSTTPKPSSRQTPARRPLQSREGSTSSLKSDSGSVQSRSSRVSTGATKREGATPPTRKKTSESLRSAHRAALSRRQPPDEQKKAATTDEQKKTATTTTASARITAKTASSARRSLDSSAPSKVTPRPTVSRASSGSEDRRGRTALSRSSPRTDPVRKKPIRSASRESRDTRSEISPSTRSVRSVRSARSARASAGDSDEVSVSSVDTRNTRNRSVSPRRKKVVPLYNGRSIEEQTEAKIDPKRKCTLRWIPNLHPDRAGCERCLHLATPAQREEFAKNGHHHRINLVRGGCSRQCSYFPRKVDEHPVRLCHKCFYDTHELKLW